MNIKSNGFTLIELLIVIAITSILGSLIANAYTGFIKANTTQNVVSELQQTLRIGMGIMGNDIRMAGLDPLRNFNFGVEQANANTIRFTSDNNMNGVLDNFALERITYNINNASNEIKQILYEGTISQDTQTFMSNVDTANSNFTFLDSNNNDLGNPVPAANLSDIRTVIITLSLQAPAGRAGMVSRQSTARLFCRNLSF